jgi:hypothetical protein
LPPGDAGAGLLGGQTGLDIDSPQTVGAGHAIALPLEDRWRDSEDAVALLTALVGRPGEDGAPRDAERWAAGDGGAPLADAWSGGGFAPPAVRPAPAGASPPAPDGGPAAVPPALGGTGGTAGNAGAGAPEGVAASYAGGWTTAPARASRAPAQRRARLGALPLSFEKNMGQSDARVDYLARAGSGTVFLTPTAAVFAMQNSGFRIPNSEVGIRSVRPEGRSTIPGAAVYMQIVGANPSARPVGLEQQPGRVNYFRGNDPARWHTDVPTFGRVEYRGVYPGILLAYYGGPGGLEYDFTVAPGADPHAVVLNFRGADRVELDSQGDLVAHTAVGDVVQHAPVVYQDVDGARHAVAGAFRLNQTGAACAAAPAALCPPPTASFSVGPYDPTRPLVIDPLVLGYSTYLGGSGSEDNDISAAIVADPTGSAYITGTTASPDFPTTPGAFDTGYHGPGEDAFVAKLNPAGNALVYSTYLAGDKWDLGYGIAVDQAGSAYVAGETISSDFPTTPRAFQRTIGGSTDAFITKLSPGGDALVYSTYFGGSQVEVANGLAVDGAGNAYIAGNTDSPDMPVTPGAFDTTYNGGKYGGDAFAAKLSPDGSALVYGTYLGGGLDDYGYGIAVDHAGSAYVVGATNSGDFPSTPGAFQPSFQGGPDDAFVTKLSPDGSALAYSTFLGGEWDDLAYAVAVDASGAAYVTGLADSVNFPTTPGAFQATFKGSPAFVAKLNASGSGLAYGTFLGGSNYETGYGIAVDGAGRAAVTGYTQSSNFPVTPVGFQTVYGGNGDGFLVRFNGAGSALLYGTYLGGSGGDAGYKVALDATGSVYVTGATSSANFPVTPGAFDTTYNGGGSDAFVTKFCLQPCRGPAVPKPAPG